MKKTQNDGSNASASGAKPRNKYWADRVNRELEEARSRTLKQTEAELRKVYSDQATKMYARIVQVFNKILKDSKSDKIMINDLYRTKRYWELLDYINSNLSSLGERELEIIRKALIETYEYAGKVIDEQPQSKNIGEHGSPRSAEPTISFLNTSAIKPEDVINQVWAMDGKDFSSRIWNNKKALFEQLTKLLQDYMVQGVSPWTIAEKLSEALQKSEYEAYRLVRTETAHLQIKAKTEKYKAMGYTKGKYIGTNCCDECKKLTGKIFTLDELETLIPQHPNCRCDFLLQPKEKPQW